MSNNEYKYYTQVSTLTRNSVPFYLNQMNQAVLRKATGNKNAKIEVTIAPMAYTLNIANFENTGIIIKFYIFLLVS